MAIPVLSGLGDYIGGELSSIPTTLGYLFGGIAQSGFNTGYNAAAAAQNAVGITVPDENTAISDVQHAFDLTSGVDLSQLPAQISSKDGSSSPLTKDLLIVVGVLGAVVLLRK